MSEISKSYKKYLNANLLKISYWVIASVAIIHLDTFISIFGIDGENKLFEVENLVYLSVFMLISIIALKFYQHMAAFTISIIKHCHWYFIERKRDDYKYNRNKDEEKMESYELLRNAIRSNNSVAYNYYVQFKQKENELMKLYEFSAYSLFIAFINISMKGSLYEFILMIDDENIWFLIAFLKIIFILASIILANYSLIRESKISNHIVKKDIFEN